MTCETCGRETAATIRYCSHFHEKYDHLKTPSSMCRAAKTVCPGCFLVDLAKRIETSEGLTVRSGA